ncbi:MAG: TrmH family RNA methyltransferase [bacterium]|nr:TrmH family RNA methyltransferase [bacterium]
MSTIKTFSTDELVAAKPTLEKFKSMPRVPISILLDNVRSLQNVGLFFRLCDGFRVNRLYLTGITGYPPLLPKQETRRPGVVEHAEREIQKTAIQTVPFVTWEYHEDPMAVVRKEKEEGASVGAVELTDKSIPSSEASWSFPLLLIFGHEREGVQQTLLSAADSITHISMFGMGNSHNVAVSGGIILSAAFASLPTPPAPTDPLGK